MLCSHQFDVFHLPDPESNSWLIHILPAASAQPKGAPDCEHRLGLVFLFMGDMMEKVPHRAFRGVCKHHIYSKNWSGNHKKLRLANSKGSKQFLSSAFFNIPPLPALNFWAGSFSFVPPGSRLDLHLPTLSRTWSSNNSLFKKALPSSIRWLSSRTSIPCQARQGLLPAPQIGDKVIQITLTRSLFICSTENTKATPKDLRFQLKLIHCNPFCFCRYVFFIKHHQSGN